MKFAIMGAGAIGCYFGARLSAAGEEVHFISRGAHLAAMRKDGLKIESDRGNLHLTKPLLTDNPATIGPVDYILFCVKIARIQPIGRPPGSILSRERRDFSPRKS